MSLLEEICREYGVSAYDPDKSDKSPSVSSVSSICKGNSESVHASVSSVRTHDKHSNKENRKSKTHTRLPLTKPTKRLRSAMEQRRLLLLEQMANDSEAKKYYWLTDIVSDADYIIVALAVRDLATCELLIRKDRYDPFDFLKIVDHCE